MYYNPKVFKDADEIINIFYACDKDLDKFIVKAQMYYNKEDLPFIHYLLFRVDSHACLKGYEDGYNIGYTDCDDSWKRIEDFRDDKE